MDSLSTANFAWFLLDENQLFARRDWQIESRLKPRRARALRVAVSPWGMELL